MSKTEITSKKQPHIIIVDDDELALTSLHEVFADDGYEVSTFRSPGEAIEIFKRTDIDLVISDFLMPEMQGLHFLKEVKELSPEVPRILLTGYAGKENAIRAINEVGLYHYLEKPWDNDYLRLVARNAIGDKSLRIVLDEKISALDKTVLQRDALLQQNETIREGLKFARQLQYNILPKSMPDIDSFTFSVKYEPTFEIGGDFYDMIPLTGGKVALLLADVTGHGVQAALLTTMLKFLFSEFRSRDASPQEILSYMNEKLYDILPVGVFVATLVLSFDPARKEVIIVNSGIPYPILLSRKRDSVTRVMANGLVLGVVRDDLYSPGKEFKIYLEKEDSLFFYTDGLSEIENEVGEQLDGELLNQIVFEHRDKVGEHALQEILRSADHFCNPDYQKDDITILSIDTR